MNTHDTDRQTPASAKNAAAPDPRPDQIDAFVNALVRGDRDRARGIFDAALTREPSIPRVYQDLVQLALYQIGELWESGQISVASEHMATAITEQLMNGIYSRLINPARTGRKVVIATVEQEEHQVGAKMASDMFEMHGWDALFPGTGITTSELLALIGRERPALLGLSFSIAAHSATLQIMLRRIREQYPRLPILVGGQGLRWTDKAAWSDLGDVLCIASLDVLDAHIRQLDGTGLGSGPELGATPIIAPGQD